MELRLRQLSLLALELRQKGHKKFKIKTQTPTFISSINRLTPTSKEVKKMCHHQEEAKKMSVCGWNGFQCGYCGDAFKNEGELAEHIRGECTYPNKY